MAYTRLGSRLKRLEAQGRPSARVVYAEPDISDEYIAEVWQLLMQYGLYESEEALMQALEQQAQRYEDAL